MAAPEIKNGQNNIEFRILVLMPTGRDSLLVSQTLESAGLVAEVCTNFHHLETNINAGVGAILLAEEALEEKTFDRFVEIIQQQAVWSDIPVVLLAADQQNSEKLLNSVGTQINITIVERPLPKAILISAMRGALRARIKQYQTRNLLIELKEADHQKDLFLATLSHELRTPLNSMLGWIELLKREDQGLDRKHAMSVIERNAKAQTQIISDILLLSRIVTGKFEIEFDLININDVIQSAVDTVQPLIEEKKINLTLTFDEAHCKVNGDFDRLQQVFWNLLSNAVKFTSIKGQISIETTCENDFLFVKISDNGQGIKADFLPFIFERFRQADNSYTRSVGGLGLGLAIVRNIVEQHNGSISGESDGEGLGTAFTVKLPLAAIPQENLQVKTKSDLRVETTLKGLRVLLADDDHDSREMLGVLLAKYEFEIESVPNASEALKIVAQNAPQLLISDVGMPDMDGYQLIKKIRQLPPDKGGQVPAIALTGYASSQDRLRALESGYQAHLSKPLDFDELFQTIESVLARST